MAVILLYTITIGTCYLVSRRDLFSPATVFGVSACLNAWTFYIIGVHGNYPPFVETWWQVQYDYHQAAATVMLVYAMQIGMALGVRWLTDRESLGDDDALEATSNHWQLDEIERYLSGPAVVVAFGVLLAICVWHFMSIDLDKVLYYEEYLSVREPENAGLNSRILVAFHAFLPQLGCLLSVLTTYFFCRGNRRMFWLSLVPFLYVLTITASFVSRAVVAQLGLAWLVLNLYPTEDRRWWQRASIVLPLIVYGAVLSLRYEEGNEGSYGLWPFLALLTGGRFLLSHAFFTVTFNLFDGGFGLGHAVLYHANLEHTLRYKLHSFFPGPSFIDGFSSFRDVDELRPDPNSPYGGFAEAYLFGRGYFLFYSSVVFFVLWTVTRFWKRYRWGPGILIACVSYMTFFYMQTYQIRNSFRLLVGAAAVAWAFDWFAQWRAAKSLGYEIPEPYPESD